MEALLAYTLFGSALVFWLAVAALIIIFFISDSAENGYGAAISIAIFAALVYFFGEYKPVLAVITDKYQWIILYVALGLVFAILRSFFAGRKFAKDTKDLPNDPNYEEGKSAKYGSKERAVQEFIEDDLKGNVLRWWFMWPVSFLTWLVKDIVTDMYDYLYSKVKTFFKYIVMKGVQSVK